MQLTFLGNSYESEVPSVSAVQLTPFIGKYRGVEFIATNCTASISANRQRKYRGVTY